MSPYAISIVLGAVAMVMGVVALVKKIKAVEVSSAPEIPPLFKVVPVNLDKRYFSVNVEKLCEPSGEEVSKAVYWALRQDYQSVAARYAKKIAIAYCQQQAHVVMLREWLREQKDFVEHDENNYYSVGYDQALTHIIARIEKTFFVPTHLTKGTQDANP